MRAAVLALGIAALGCADATPAPAPAAGVDPAAYDRWRQPERVVAALELAPGQTVADIGAGTGYLSLRLARAVGPRGRVVATDIDRAALAEIERAPRQVDLAPIEARVVEPADLGLEPGRYDRILLAQVDHLLADRADYLRRLRPALAPGGRIAVANRIYHRPALLDAAGAAGYQTVSELSDLPGQYLVVLAPVDKEMP